MEQTNKENSTIYWHPAFYAGIQIELLDDADNLEFESEHLLSKKPMQIDVMIIKKEADRPVKKNIGRFFRKRNIVEYKSPDDSLSVDDYYKVYGYTCFYKSEGAVVNEIPLEDLTITLVSESYPRELIRHLRDSRGFKVEKVEDGIYSIVGDTIPIQLLVTRQLSQKENLWLRSLTNKLDTRENAELLIEDYIGHQKNNLHKAVIETIMRANQKLFEEVNGVSDIIMEIVQEKFDRKLKEELDKETKIIKKKMEIEVKKQMEIEVKKQMEIEVKKQMEIEVKKEAENIKLTERITMVWKKCAKNKPLPVIADEMETEPAEVLPIYSLITENPGKTVDEIYTLFVKSL